MKNTGESKARILVVEDETIVAMDIRQRLENMQYDVVDTVVTGEQAIHKVQALKPDLVLMDIKLKGRIDGIQAADAIRKNYATPVIFLTAFADEATLTRARITEAFGYILKPFEERELKVNIEIALYKHRMERKLRESEERYSLAMRGANDGLWDMNISEGDVFFSPRFNEILGFSDGELGTSLDDWLKRLHPEDVERFKVDMADHLAGLRPHFQLEHRMLRKNGTEIWTLTRGLALFDADGIPYRMAGSLTDITERKLVEEQLVHGAFHDTLTDLPNRALFMDRLQRAIDRAKRHEKDHYAVLFLDLDRFKVVNDSLGHQQGDELLVFFAERLKMILRTTDTLARLGGDEFVILLEEVADINDAMVVSERIQEDLKQPFLLDGQNVFMSTSIGIVTGSPEYERPEDILRDADIAMYRAKSDGKARSTVFDTDFREHAMKRLGLEGDLRVALARNELKVFYQPILSLTNRKIMGFEALLRWFHPVRGLVSPADFVPLAEETGLIVPIGRWVLKEACRQLATWQMKFSTEPVLTMSVNISPRQFIQPEFFDQIKQIIMETGVDPFTLKLELTESMLLENSPAAVDNLNRLRQIGIQLLIDDFGTGYSSLGYVQHFPINTIKIDRIFITHMGEKDYEAEIARTIVQLARKLGLETIAEGIETEQQLSMLRDLECMYGQGWLFSKAASSEKIETLLEKDIHI